MVSTAFLCRNRKTAPQPWQAIAQRFGSIPVCSVVCAPLSWSTKHFQTARLGLRTSEQPFAQGRLSTSSADLFACSGNLLIFLVWLRRVLIALAANSRPALKQCVTSNRPARQACENLPKVCPHKQRDLHFDSGRLSICANWLFYMNDSRFHKYFVSK